MATLKDDPFLKRQRATWLSEKLDINFARANAIMNQGVIPSSKQTRLISKAIRTETRASVYKSKKK
ncbi:MAG: hypothetical protein IPM71_02020 [Bacteroidota bacterium]|nr:MAG: hypothetical protein IPM71_02020 [Bacteroidota bacterium]